MTDQFLDHPILSSRYFYPWPNRFEKSFFVEGNAVTCAVVNGKPVITGLNAYINP
jgi:hypothetical protein